MLPQLAQGSANKIFVIPSEFTQALGNLGSAVGDRLNGGGPDGGGPEGGVDLPPVPLEGEDAASAAALAEAEQAAAEATRAAQEAATPGRPGGTPPPVS
jgi:hypothetical protein